MKDYLKIISLFIFITTFSQANLTHATKIGYKTIKYSDGSIKKGGHRNWRNNNPGNLEYGKLE